ncbi:MAG: MazG nucleotide pyrophosphohydrolase domain-containing protein [Planctomycetota bacterium]|jgi:NTP pyrophosphatase (non-canonical NTP hydrolase)
MHIGQFQHLILEKYGNRDRQRGTPATFMWFIEEVGELATTLAAQDEQDKAEEFADVFAWLCTLANINGIDLEKACEKYTANDIQGFK